MTIENKKNLMKKMKDIIMDKIIIIKIINIIIKIIENIRINKNILKIIINTKKMSIYINTKKLN